MALVNSQLPSRDRIHFCCDHSEFYTVECPRCVAEEIRGSVGLVGFLALAGAIVLLAVLVCLLAHFTVGSR